MSFAQELDKRMPLFIVLLLFLSIPSPAGAKVPTFRWSYGVDGEVTSVALSPDGRYVAAGGANGRVYVLHENGSLFWSYEVGSRVQDVAISGQGDVLAGDSDTLYLINATGGLRWEQYIGDYVRSVAFSPEGDYVVAGSSDHMAYLFDLGGTRLWRYNTGSSVQGVALSGNGDRIAAGAGTNFFLLDNAGNLLWKYDIGSFIWDVDMSAEGGSAVAGARGIYLLDTENEEFVYRPPMGDEISGVAMLENGREVLAGGPSGHIYSYTSAGAYQWSYQFNESVAGVAMRPKGELMAAASGSTVYLLESPDTVPPEIKLSIVTDPESGEVWIKTAVDDSEAGVKVFVDGQSLQNLTYLWDAGSASKGNHTIRVEATDAEGNTGYTTATVEISGEKVAVVVEEKEAEGENAIEEEPAPEETAPPPEVNKTEVEELQERIEGYKDVLLPLGKPEQPPTERYSPFVIGGALLVFAVWFLITLRRFGAGGGGKYRWKR